ncbi:hypothetical protein E4K67_28085 [Desulfosporosinus fructosivorans]|uniref:Uncharacterized protein n=1 Tax=Desulfosporosinus fructosivorans TaxID=2018669 RepID=A0A4Z0QY47_9FIRM|nr:hypothetical protein [Desulfosporosinus fructosivorans]TGE34945.1 hypothetical protein E4K67_28085 [Desulfosporosinus fructosivorans]
MNKVLGKYSFQDIVYLESNYRHEDIFIPSIHELMHMYLIKNSYFGTLAFFINQEYTNNLFNFDNGNLNQNEILSYFLKLLKEASEITYESIAYYAQYAYIKMEKNNNEYLDNVTKLKDIDVYKMYKLKRMLKFLDRKDWMELLSNNFIIRIGFIALNINMLSFVEKGIFNKNNLINMLVNESLDYKPDKRFSLLLEVLDDLLEVEDANNITDEMIIKKANISTQKIDKNGLLEVLNYLKSQYQLLNISVDLLEKNIDILLNRSEEDFITKDINEKKVYEDLDLIKPIAIKNNYEIINNIPIDKFKLDIGLFSSIWIVNMNRFYLLMFDDLGWGKRYLFYASHNECKDILCKYELPLILFYEDYEELLRRFPQIVNRELFIYLEMPYAIIKTTIEKYISDGREIMLHKLNDDVIFLFIKLKGKSVLVTQLVRYTLKSIAQDIKDKNFNYVNVDKETRVDGCFWFNDKDWWKYEDIIKSISQKSFFNEDPSTPGLGYRMRIDDV